MNADLAGQGTANSRVVRMAGGAWSRGARW